MSSCQVSKPNKLVMLLFLLVWSSVAQLGRALCWQCQGCWFISCRDHTHTQNVCPHCTKLLWIKVSAKGYITFLLLSSDLPSLLPLLKSLSTMFHYSNFYSTSCASVYIGDSLKEISHRTKQGKCHGVCLPLS